MRPSFPAENSASSDNLAAQQLAQKADWQWEEGHLREAISLFRQAVDLDPEFTYARIQVTRLLLETDQDRDAFPHLQYLVNVDDIEDPELLNAYGLFLKERGKIEEAEEIFRHIIALAPDYDAAYANLALIFYEAGEMEMAVGALEEFIQLAQDSQEKEDAMRMLRQWKRTIR